MPLGLARIDTTLKNPGAAAANWPLDHGAAPLRVFAYSGNRKFPPKWRKFVLGFFRAKQIGPSATSIDRNLDHFVGATQPSWPGSAAVHPMHG